MAVSAPAPRPDALASRPDRLLAIGVAAAGLLSRLPFVNAEEGWFDEIFSIYTAAQSLPEILRGALIEQTNPPGYYLLAHVWNALGGSGVAWHRVLTAIAGALAPALVLLAARRLGFSRWAAVVAAVVALASPFLWQMSLEVRAYAPLALLAAWALWIGAGIATSDEAPSPRAIAALAGLQVGMALLHYFGAFAVFGLTLGVVAGQRAQRGASWAECLRLLVVLGGPAAVVLATWVGVAFLGGEGLGGRNVAWIPETSAAIALRNVVDILLPSLAGGAAVGGLWLLAGIGVAGREARRGAAGRFVLLAALLPVAIALALHLSSERPLWVARYLTGFIPALALLPAFVVDAVPRAARRVLAIGLLLWTLVGGSIAFADRWPKPDWTRMIADLAPSGRATLCVDQSIVGLPLLYYARVLEATELRIVNVANCRPQGGPTWLVYNVEFAGLTAAPLPPDASLGPRIVMFRGLQSVDARRVIPAAAGDATP